MPHLRTHVFISSGVLACVWICTPGLMAQEAPPTRIADLLATPRIEAAKRPAIRIRGVVSLVGEGLASTPKLPPVLLSFCIEDESAGIWVVVAQARRENLWTGDQDALLALHEGSEIEMEGVLDEGAFAPVIVPRTLRVLGEKALPPARVVSLARLMSGAEDVRRVQVSGVVQSIADEGGTRWLLKVETGLGHFLCRLPKTADFAPARLLDAEVQMTGLAAVSRNWRAEFVCPRLVISHEKDVVILKAAPADPFAARKVPLNELDSFSPEGRPLHRRRIEGVVTFHQPGSYLFLQEGKSAVRVESSVAESLTPGDRVEATGFIDTSRHVAGLSGALIRCRAGGPPPEAVPIRMREIAADFREMKAGRPARLPGCDGLLVSVTGRLLSVQGPSLDGEVRLELECEDSVTTAFLRGRVDELIPGTELRATGVASVQYAPEVQTANFAQPTRLDLLLRDQSDITILRAASWWTPQRTTAALFGLLAISGAALVWAVALRRTVAKQTHQLALEMRGRRDAAVEFQAALRERSRLAANLHDTVLQTMTGIAYQIEACESESLPGPQRTANHLETARRMVQRGQEDLRNAVWALRALPVKEGTFTEAVRSVARQISAGHEVDITVEDAHELPALADFIAGNLLLIVQEAVHNALKHAAPKHVRIILDAPAGGGRLSLLVEDDGAGFVPGSQPGTSAGHFGLVGMRERAERLDGTLRVESQPAAGTRVRVEVPLHPFDHELA